MTSLILILLRKGVIRPQKLVQQQETKIFIIKLSHYDKPEFQESVDELIFNKVSWCLSVTVWPFFPWKQFYFNLTQKIFTIITSERPNRGKFRFGRNRSFGHIHRSFGRSFGRISVPKITKNRRFWCPKSIKLNYLSNAFRISIMMPLILKFIINFQIAQISSWLKVRKNVKMGQKYAKMTFFSDSAIR